MQKIITLFARNYDGDRLVRDEVTPGAEWVATGEGVATRKFDGTCCLVRGGLLYKRHEVRQVGTGTGGGVFSVAYPFGWGPAGGMDPVTGKVQGWVPVGEGPEDRWHREAWAACPGLPDGTYELCGPKVQGNPERFETYVLVPHGCEALLDCPRDFAGLRDYLLARAIEGVVFHHPDGRMVKIKRRDFTKEKPAGR